MLAVKDKKKFIRGILIIIIVLLLLIGILWGFISIVKALFTKKVDNQGNNQNQKSNMVDTNQINQVTQVSTIPENSVLNEWNLKLVNNDNSVDKSYVPELEEYADGIMFDKRAIGYLRNMINAMHKDNITGIWVQSAYRSYEKQEELFNRKVTSYKNQGKGQAEAERLAQMVVQRPEMSEHNLALAADFNTVTNEFENTRAFTWLQKNAANYGFILRYPKDKQDITKITYESWHWRYVGKEHAKVMKEKGYCLEEYIDYLKGVESV